MATETVIYVSLALVLLTRIYVFISPPEFLEEHKDRRYHEYHLYRQYHLHKQYDKNDPQAQEQQQQQQQQHESSQDGRENSRSLLSQQHSSLEGGYLHHPSDEFVLLGGDTGGHHPFPLSELSPEALSVLDPIIISSLPRSFSSTTMPYSATTTPHSPRESERGIWRQILGPSSSVSGSSINNSNETGVPESLLAPHYLSLDISEIHYNGSLEKFNQDAEVQESVRGLKAGQRDMAKECPTMTMVWEGGRWCCLEGRTLYILKAMEWQGQVRVRVLVDKDPMLLAVTEDYWKAAGMTSDLTPLVATTTPATMSTSTSAATLSPSTPLSSTELPISPLTPLSVSSWDPPMDSGDSKEISGDGSSSSSSSHVQTAAASTEDSAVTVRLSLDDADPRELTQNATAMSRILNSPARFRRSVSEGHAYLGSPGSHDADDEVDLDDEDNEGDVESDGYIEDDEGEGDQEDDQEIGQRLKAITLALNRGGHQRPWHGAGNDQRSRSTISAWPLSQRPVMLQEEDDNTSNVVSRPWDPVSPTLSPTLSLPPDHIHPHPYAHSKSPLSVLPLPQRTARKPSFGRLYQSSDSNCNSNVQQHAHSATKALHQHQQYHERKISIPEFMLPPPFKDERAYLIIDPTLSSAKTAGSVRTAGGIMRENPPRRDSGHGDCP
ncbi:hypothetical protein EDD11_007999 [Mortierella claussenii]|nr:hypothetical protein EDD11_007999 [Mortierella claussenii]